MQATVCMTLDFLFICMQMFYAYEARRIVENGLAFVFRRTDTESQGYSNLNRPLKNKYKSLLKFKTGHGQGMGIHLLTLASSLCRLFASVNGSALERRGSATECNKAAA